MSTFRTSLALSRALRLQTRAAIPASPLLRVSSRTTRCYATGDKQPSAVATFYKTFSRPVLKVLLMATFTYQVLYLLWAKLENDEIRDERTEELAALEAGVKHQAASQRVKLADAKTK